MSSSRNRLVMDVRKLMMAYKVELIDDEMKNFYVYFHGPKDSLRNVFEVFLPQLLLYPNPSDPLNDEAAGLMMSDLPVYELRVKGEV
ncbi:hypothetical protein J5N97_030001 [Dioscorea zingiberensis]|uniref:Uncharacterized protein n=1 Tax=Dioscorea zingiberensis TaxID=325984 RepID=A0A9D5BWT5_9LILI|nr:hypothetical protein J5N97_030001 [Dioscorea zingiberensis]